MRAERDYEPGEERDPAPEDLITPVLERLAAADQDFDFANLPRQWNRHGCLSPKQMALVAWRLREHGIDHEPSAFRVSTERPEDKAAIAEMEPWKLERLLPYLTEQQIRELGI